MKFIIAILLLVSSAKAKEIALSFDDAPGETTLHFTPDQRTDELIRKLKELKVPPTIIFANPCNGSGPKSNLAQLTKFKNAGHIIGNHTCSHPRFDVVGPERYSADTLKAESIIGSLMGEPKYFRYPFFNEGKDIASRDQFRKWLDEHKYQNVSSSLENEDPFFSNRINEAKKQNKKIDYEKIKAIFLKHIIEGVEFYDKLAIETLGRSPKHIILLHDKDATVLFIDDLVHELQKRGWTFIDAAEAAKDPLYSMKPHNVLSTYGILAQFAYEKSGSFKPYYDFAQLERELNAALGLKAMKNP
jgi:Predicted xylanase/chitin deacetylase